MSALDNYNQPTQRRIRTAINMYKMYRSSGKWPCSSYGCGGCAFFRAQGCELCLVSKAQYNKDITNETLENTIMTYIYRYLTPDELVEELL